LDHGAPPTRCTNLRQWQGLVEQGRPREPVLRPSTAEQLGLSGDRQHRPRRRLLMTGVRNAARAAEASVRSQVWQRVPTRHGAAGGAASQGRDGRVHRWRRHAERQPAARGAGVRQASTRPRRGPWVRRTCRLGGRSAPALRRRLAASGRPRRPRPAPAPRTTQPHRPEHTSKVCDDTRVSDWECSTIAEHPRAQRAREAARGDVGDSRVRPPAQPHTKHGTVELPGERSHPPHTIG
jgi:hypothetical protein